MRYKTYTKLFHTCVTPILDCYSGVWGVAKLEKINTVQNRAIRYFLGSHRCSPNLAINGDMGWSSSQTRWGVEMGRLWNRLVFMWDKSLCKRNWSYEIKHLFSNNEFENTFMTNSCVNVKLMHVVLHQQVSTTWNQDIFNVKKLSTYVTFNKQEYGTQHYVKVVTNRQTE